jgi:hypothetical protein
MSYLDECFGKDANGNAITPEPTTWLEGFRVCNGSSDTVDLIPKLNYTLNKLSCAINATASLAGAPIKIETSGSYTPSEGTKFFLALVQGGGGAGGGTPTLLQGQAAAGQPANSGATAWKWFEVVEGQEATVIIGAGGLGISGGSGGAGGDTSLTYSSLAVTAEGGVGGNLADTGLSTTYLAINNTISKTTGADWSVNGNTGGVGIINLIRGANSSTTLQGGFAGAGAASYFGSGGRVTRVFIAGTSTSGSAAGQDAEAHGASGSGAYAGRGSAAAAVSSQKGGNGGDGVILIWEYK